MSDIDLGGNYWCVIYDQSDWDDRLVELDSGWFETEQEAIAWAVENGYDDPAYNIVIEDDFGTRRTVTA